MFLYDHPSWEECKEKGGGVFMSIILPNLNHSFVWLRIPFLDSVSEFWIPDSGIWIFHTSSKTCQSAARAISLKVIEYHPHKLSITFHFVFKIFQKNNENELSALKCQM